MVWRRAMHRLLPVFLVDCVIISKSSKPYALPFCSRYLYRRVVREGDIHECTPVLRQDCNKFAHTAILTPVYKTQFVDLTFVSQCMKIHRNVAYSSKNFRLISGHPPNPTSGEEANSTLQNDILVACCTCRQNNIEIFSGCCTRFDRMSA